MAYQQVVPNEIRDQYIAEGKRLRAEGKRQPDLVHEGKRYFLDNKGKGQWRLRSRSSHSAQGAKRRANQRDATFTETDYQSAFGDKGSEMYQAYRGDLQRIWGTRGQPNMDIDHINSLKDGGFEHGRNLRLQNSSRNRSDGARGLSEAQQKALRLNSKDKIDFLRLAGPDPTPRLRQQIIDGSLHVMPIVTAANMPALGGFDSSVTPGLVTTSNRPEQPTETPPQQTYTPPDKPIEPKRDLTQRLYEASDTAVKVGTGIAVAGLGALSKAGGVIQFITGGGF